MITQTFVGDWGTRFTEKLWDWTFLWPQLGLKSGLPAASNDTSFGPWEGAAAGDGLRTLDHGVDTELKDSLT